MSNSSYFSQYESPNIVIVSNTSSNIPSSPKRRKVGNNIIVPIVQNISCEKNISKLQQADNISDGSNAAILVNKNENLSTPPSSKASWASNYLQSIGLDKKLTIWNRKIPRKKTVPSCVIAMEPNKILTGAATPSSTYIQKTSILKSDQSKIPNKIVDESITLKNCSPKIKQTAETKKHNIKDKSKNECTKPNSRKNPSGFKDNEKLNNLPCNVKYVQNDLKKMNTEKIGSNKQTVKLITSNTHNLHTKTEKKNNNLPCNNKNIQNDLKKINTEKIGSNEQTVKLITSSTRNLHSKAEKNNIKRSQNGHNSKISSKHLIAGHKQSGQTKQGKSNIKSVVTKPNSVKKNTKCDVKSNIKQNHRKSEIIKTSLSYVSGDEEKYRNPEYSIGNVTTMKNVKVSKKYDIGDVNNLSVAKKAQCNSQLKTQPVHSKTEICKKSKNKEKLTQSNSDFKLKKSIKSPSKKKVSKTKSYRKIKLVINLICNNKSNSPQCNEISNNVDLEFLNDFNIDEIVESLDSCEKKSNQYNVESHRELNRIGKKGNLDRHNLKSTISTNFNKNDQNDAIDLIKILKGEEDDDITKISLENSKELRIGRNLDISQSIENSDVLSENLSIMPIKIKEELETLSETSKAHCDFNNVIQSTKADVIVIKTQNHINKQEITKETKENGQRSKPKHLKVDDNSLSHSVIRTTNPLETLLIDLDKPNEKVEEQKINMFCDIIDLEFVNEVTNTNGNINKTESECVTVEKNNFKNSDNLCNEEQNKQNNLLIHTLQKNLNTDNVTNIADSKNYTDSSSKSETPKINTHIVNFSNVITEGNAAQGIGFKEYVKNQKIANSFNESEQENNLGHILKHENLNNDCAEKQNDDKKEECTTEIKIVKSSDVNYSKVDNLVNENNFVQNIDKPINIAEIAEDHKKLPTISNFLKADAINSDEKLQKDTNKGEKERNIEKNKQKGLTDNESTNSQAPILVNDETTHINIESKADLQTILNLEQRLFTCSGSKYCIISIIHTGKFSKIFKCKHPNGKYYALKMITTNTKYNSGKERKLMLTSLISDIPKDNLFIVHLANAFNVAEKWCFLMEYYPKNLDQTLSETGKPLSIEHIQDFTRQLVMAVMVLKNKNMVHLDIKPKHILINSTNNILKLCGFDNLSYINKMRILPNVGTVNYRAPEVILGYESGFEIDVWSTGLVLYEMATNCKLFPGIFNNDILYKQMCTLGCIPHDMLKKSRYSGVHFVGTKFMKKSGFKGQNINLISKFYKNKRLSDSIYDAYYENWGHQRSLSQQNCDIGKVGLFVKLLQKMLTVHPKFRLPIEFVYANPFIYDAYSYNEW